MPDRMILITIGGRAFDMNDEGAAKPWDYFEEWDGSRRWHALFLRYRDIPIEHRSISETYRLHAASMADLGTPVRRRFASDRWLRMARGGFWEERAAAYDDFVRWHKEREILAVNKGRIESVKERDWAEATDLRDRISRALAMVSLVIYGREQVVETWAEGDVVVPGSPKRVLVPVRLRSSPAEIARALTILSDLQRRGAGGPPPAAEAAELVAKIETQQQEESGAVKRWEGYVLSVRLEKTVVQLDAANKEIERLKALLDDAGVPY